MAFVDMNNLNMFKNTVYIHGTNDKIASAYLGAIDNTPRYDDSTFDYRVYLTKSLAQTTSLDESLFSLEYLYKNKIDAILTNTFKIDVLFDTNRSIDDIYTDLDKVYLNNSIGIFDLSTCFYTTPLAKQIPLFTTIEQETLDNFYKNNDIFKDIEDDENLFNEVISNIENIHKLSNIDEFYTYIKTNYLKHYKLNKIINTIYFNLINDFVNKYNENINSYLTFYDFTTKFGITSDKYNASKIVDLYNYIIKMQELISFTLSNHTKIEEGMEIIEKLDEKFPIPEENKYNLVWKDSNSLNFEVNLYSPNDDVVIAGSDRSNKGIYYSEDNGKTWSPSNITEGNFYRFNYIDNGTKKVIVAGGMTNEGIYYSEDNGKTWNQSNISSGSIYEFGIINNTLVAIIDSISTELQGIYYSTDFGETWERSNLIDKGYKCFINLGDSILVSSKTNGLYKSDDEGRTWSQVNSQPSIENKDFRCLTTIGSMVIASSYSGNGLYYSEDNGASWIQSNIKEGNFVAISSIDNYVVAGGNSDQGLYYSEDNGKTWSRSNITSSDFSHIITLNNMFIAASSSLDGVYYSNDFGKTWNEFSEFYSYTNSLIVHNGSALICITDSNIEEPRSVVKYSEFVESKLEFKGKTIPNLYNVLWSITDSRLSKLITIKENTEMYNYFSKQLIQNNITEELNKFMILGKDIIHPLLESSKNGSLSMDENQIDKVYSVLTENYCKIKCLINSLKNNKINLEELPDNNEFIVYLYISVFILMTLSIISSSSSKNKVFEVVDFDTIMQVLGIDYQKVYNEEDILNFISKEMNK